MPIVVIDENFIPKATKLLKKHPEKKPKIRKTIELLQANPRHPSLRTKKYDQNLDMWQSYVENQTPSAWRMWWQWSQTEQDTIVIIGYGPHP